ncbi:unnamed protein product [Dovyalis caffra]|uniref:Uncharacterized protein n=1 Tax=Dovyalis caffra TaxID=77055 RepID=A0AAV1SLA8_9ROSI|nr:unnamed protein product [Dovyalis caffra]
MDNADWLIRRHSTVTAWDVTFEYRYSSNVFYSQCVSYNDTVTPQNINQTNGKHRSLSKEDAGGQASVSSLRF